MNESRLSKLPPLAVPAWVGGIAFSVVAGVAGLFEISRWTNPETRNEILTGWMCGRDADWLPFIPLLLAALIVSGIRTARRKESTPYAFQQWLRTSAERPATIWTTWSAAIFVFVFGLVASLLTQSSFEGLPPAYHDEYSYRFQAHTILDGKLSYPSVAEHPEMFDQVHVLNEGRYASRYFPGTGLWLAPFLAIGQIYLAQAVAHAFTAMMLFWAGRELSSTGVGLLAGLLFAVSPGMLLFSTLLLSHSPTLVGLSLFLWSMLNWLRTRRTPVLLLAGTGLAFAMLCRPMTAAGFALPFGAVFAYWWATGRPLKHVVESTQSLSETQELTRIVHKHFLPVQEPATQIEPFLQRTLSALCLGGPLLIGVFVLAGTQWSITGDPTLSPYQQYTDIYTPRHRYGFNNVVLGEQNLGPKVIENYDRWAENLTYSKAISNTSTRLVTSLRWSLGILPITLAAVVVLLTPKLGSRRWYLIFLSILSLHLAHVPYWFTGIMNWHYVLETAPLWLLIFAEGSSRLHRTWVHYRYPGLRVWWGALILLAVSVNLITVRPLWPGRLPQGLAEIAYPRKLYGAFVETANELRGDHPAIVFVIPDPADRHMDYVVNVPPLESQAVIVARIPDRKTIADRESLFPQRAVLVFDASTKTWAKIRDVMTTPAPAETPEGQSSAPNSAP